MPMSYKNYSVPNCIIYDYGFLVEVVPLNKRVGSVLPTVTYSTSARNKIKRLLISNSIYSYKKDFIPFVATMTFADQDNGSDWKWVNKQYKKFYEYMRVNSSLTNGYRYVVIFEKTKKNVYHFHMVLFGLSINSIDTIKKYWSVNYGHILVSSFPCSYFDLNSIIKLSNYLSKYLTKTNRSFSHRAYFYSQLSNPPVKYSAYVKNPFDNLAEYSIEYKNYLMGSFNFAYYYIDKKLFNKLCINLPRYFACEYIKNPYILNREIAKENKKNNSKITDQCVLDQFISNF